MKDERSHAGFALMEPAFLRVLSGESSAGARTTPSLGARAAFDGWCSRTAARWTLLTAGVATKRRPGKTQ